MIMVAEFWLCPHITEGNQPWIFIRRTDAEAETPILWPADTKSYWKRPWCWERGEGGHRVWHGWVASPIQWTWAWANSRSQWRTGKPGVLQSMGSQRVGHDLSTQQQLPHELTASQRPLLLILSLWGLDFNIRIWGDTFIYYLHSYANHILSC